VCFFGHSETKPQNPSLPNLPTSYESENVAEHPSPFKSKGGFRRIAAALGYSYKGLKAAVRYESAFRQELILAVVLAPCAFLLGRNALEVILLMGMVLMVMIVELLNSAIEAVADAVSLESHPLLGRAKDLGSAAVFVALATAVLVWIGMIVVRIVH
jgi:diacylglycerol kinase (ATP)